MTLKQPNSRIVRNPPKNAKVLQPGSRLCRYPARDLLTGARIEAGADVRVVSEYEWYGARQQKRATEYGAVNGGVGIARELQDWPARNAAIEAQRARDEESA